ncbi:hypothetical protein FRC03_001839 [Tulasnella sp. 419]|nr:hypothetical protein FRC03_001839 [Tulasnella sp. 419]
MNQPIISLASLGQHHEDRGVSRTELIKELPLELLRRIFLHCCEIISPKKHKPEGAWYKTGMDATYASNPIALTHVSRYWRDAAIGCRPIWSFISITQNTPLEKIGVWLERSGSCLLDVVIHPIRENSSGHVADLLIPHTYRWRSIYMEEGQILSYPPFLKLLDQWVRHPDSVDNLPKLQVLEYDSGRAGVEYGCWMCLKTSNGKAMMGRRLGIPWEGVTSDICTDEFWKSYIQSLSKVTHLQVSVRSYMFNHAESAGLMVAIDLMKALQHLEVEIIEDKEPYSSKEREITMMLPELRTFNLRLRKPCPSLWAWLKNLDVPSLSGLTIWHQAPHQNEEWHNRLDREGWLTLRRAVKLPLVSHFHWIPQSESCPRCLTQLLHLIHSIIQMTVDVSQISGDTFSMEDLLLPFFSQFPALQSININGWVPSRYSDDPRRSDILELITRFNSDVVVMFDGEL